MYYLLYFHLNGIENFQNRVFLDYYKENGKRIYFSKKGEIVKFFKDTGYAIFKSNRELPVNIAFVYRFDNKPDFIGRIRNIYDVKNTKIQRFIKMFFISQKI